MHKLADAQREFARALFGAGERETITQTLVEPAGVDPAARLEVYRNNVFSNYRGALQAVYPAVERLVGTGFFRHACNAYIERYPSSSGDLHDFGAAFAEFLESYEHTQTLVYLPDVARLEWLYHLVFHAASHAPLDLTRFASLAPDDYAALRFTLHPAAALLRSAYPILRIWQVNQPDFTGDTSVDLGEGGDALLFTREDFVVKIERIAAAHYALLDALHGGAPLSQAVDAAVAADGQFDLQAALAHYVSAGIIVDFAAPGAA